MKRNNKKINFSKRKFNIFLLLSLLFISLPKKFVNSKDNSVKKIKYNNFVWYLNKKDSNKVFTYVDLYKIKMDA